MKTAGIYIHIPFCKTKCIYCDFYSVAGQDDRIDIFTDMLIKEIENCLVDTSHWRFDTIFIGGGTPSLLNAQQIELIIDTLSKTYDLSNIEEFTIEVNPGEAPKKKLNDLRSLGLNRLSIGVQSFKPELLHFLSRIHSTDDVFRTFKSARNIGFDNINCDLIYNIPGQSLNDWQSDLDKLIELNPEHISAYSLTVEENTKLHELIIGKQVESLDDELHEHFTTTTLTTLSKNNYYQYEISNYSKPNMECFHNLHYWKNDSYLGFGPSAHSFDGKYRWKNFSNLDKYISLINDNKSTIEFSENLTEINQTNEIVGFGLRMTQGFDILQIPISLRSIFKNQLEQAKVKFPTMIIEDDNRIRLTQKGMIFADAIAVEFMLPNIQNA